MKLVTAEQMRSLEQRSDASGNSYAMMMERAGKAVADALTAQLLARETRQNHVLVLVGPGNNGGDGLVCARELFDTGARVSLYIWKRAPKDTDENYRLCLERNIPVMRAENDPGFASLKELLDHNDVIVDALLGTGVSKPIEGILKDLLAIAKERLDRALAAELASLIPTGGPVKRRPLVVAVDLPSGLNPDTGAVDPATLPADLTVTFAFPKVGQLIPPGAFAVGELTVADIGIPADWARDSSLEVESAQDASKSLPARPRGSHKGTFGKAMLCVGSANYIGAAYLAGTAATHAGAGLVTLALARTIHPIVAAASHETTFVPLPDEGGALVPEAIPALLDSLSDYDALLVGPGFGRNPQTIRFTQGLLGGKHKLPKLVIDADGLYALSQLPDWSQVFATGGYRAILTPHPGEMATLCGLKPDQVQADRVGVAKKFATQWQQTIVLKGAYTIVADGSGRITIIPFATPALATAGTGDVLAGTIVALLAQQLDPYVAAVTGAYLHGLAGELCQREIGEAGVVAGDLLPRLPRAIRTLREFGGG